jgi:FkbM family methyltransferase
MLTKIYRGLDRLRDGTLLDRLQERRHERQLTKRREWWNAHPDEPNEVEFEVQPNVRMRLNRRNTLSKLIYCEDFEWVERRFANDFLKPGDTYVDIGANVGLFTLIAASRVGASGRVVSFEPAAATFKGLLANVELNGFKQVSCNKLAVGAAQSEMDMTVSLDGFDAWNSLTSSLSQPVEAKKIITEKVSCVTWDSFAQEHDLVGKVTMMKIDVEGWEAHVLEGARQTLSRPDAPLLQVEFTDDACAAAGATCQQLYQALLDLGYKMYTYNAVQKQLTGDAMRERYPYANLIATKDPVAAEQRIQASTTGA